MSDVYDTLEVAKLAAFTSSQLRKIDNETSSSVPANRIDINTFKQNVIQAANPNQFSHSYNTNAGVRNSDEAKMLEFLNRQAMTQVPEINPRLIPLPDQPQASQPIAPSIPPQISPPIAQPVITTTVQPAIKANEISVGNNDSLFEIANSIKNIDNTLRELADYFLDDFKKKKSLKKNQTSVKKSKNASMLQMTNQKQQTKEYQKNVQNDTTS
jgi:hypothetical protein